MIGVNPPGHFVWEPALIDEQIQYVSALCAEDKYCSTQTDDFAASMQRVMKQMPESWLGIPIDAGKVRFVGFNMIFHVNSAAIFYDAVLAADTGDPSGLAMLSLLYSLQIRFGDPQPPIKQNCIHLNINNNFSFRSWRRVDIYVHHLTGRSRTTGGHKCPPYQFVARQRSATGGVGPLGDLFSK